MKSILRTHPGWLRTSMCAAMLATMATPSLLAQSTATPPPASSDSTANKDSETVQMEPLEITGSRIKRLDVETVSPVVEMKADDMLKIGYPTVGDAIRALPFNSGQALSPTDSGNSFTPGVSTINLRGLGNNETLVLINGRRAVPYATPGFNGLQTVFDFNSLPQSAIEGVEILKDGGSAIYGSDAVAGVVNIKMRRDFQGMSTTGEIGNYYNTDGMLKKGSVTIGNTSGKLSTFLTFDWAQQNAVFARDVKWAANADQSSRAHKANGRYTATGWEAAGFATEHDYLVALEATDAIGDGQFNLSSSRGFPGYVTVPGLGKQTFTSPTDTPTTAGAVAGYNPYNFQETAGLFPEYRTYAMYSSFRYDFNDDLYGFAELSFNRYETTPEAAATPVDIENEHGLDSGDPMVLPSYNAYNPWGVDITNGRRRLVELPTRINDVTSDTPRVLVGLGGNLPVLDGWTWESAVLYNRNSITNLNRGSVSDSRMQQALMGLTRNANGSLDWDPNTPISDRVYFNWFGMNEKAMGDFLEINNPTFDSLEYWSYDGSATGRIMDLPAGPLNVAAGFEHQAEKLNHVRTDLNAQAGIVGGSEGSSSHGQRSVTSFYTEFDVPVLKQVELQLAARYENYSDDGFKDKARPKIGIKIRPFNWLMLRGSFSQSFKAPDLSYLYNASSTSFSEFQVVDPVTHNEIDQVQIVTAGNPELKPETSDVWFGGIVLEAPERSFLKGLEASVEYFDLNQKDALAQLSDFYGYAEFFQENANGNPLFAGKVVRDPNTQEVLYIKDDYTNISSTHYKAIDFGLRYTKPTESMGTFTFTADATKLQSYVLDGSEIAGNYLTPKWNGTGSVTWSKGDWTINAYEIVKGGSRRDLSFGNIFTDQDELFLTYDMKPQWITNASVSYRGFGRSTITVGATNLFNTEPPEDPFQQIGTTPGVNFAEPGFWYVRVGHDF